MVDFNMTKVIHAITTIERGGAENQLIILCREQIKMGLEIQIVYFKGLPTLKQEFETIGVTVTEVSGNLVRQVYRLRKLIKNSRASIIHAHLPQAELTSVLSKGRVPLVISRHNAERFLPRGPVWLSKLLSRFVLKRTKGRIAISNHVNHFVMNAGESVLECAFSTVYYGYHFQSLYPKINRSIDEPLRLITIGRLVPQKDISTTLKALSILESKGIAFQMTILGEGPLELELKNLSRSLGISKRISFLLINPNVFLTTLESDIFFFSRTHEGYGLVILEAMDAQVPIVCSAIPTLKEILGSNYRGLFEVGNSDSLVKTLLYSIENAPKLLIDMKSKEEKFDSRKMAVEISAIYSKAFLS